MVLILSQLPEMSAKYSLCVWKYLFDLNPSSFVFNIHCELVLDLRDFCKLDSYANWDFCEPDLDLNRDFCKPGSVANQWGYPLRIASGGYELTADGGQHVMCSGLRIYKWSPQQCLATNVGHQIFTNFPYLKTNDTDVTITIMQGRHPTQHHLTSTQS